MKRSVFISIFCLVISGTMQAQSSHPKGLITREEAEILKAKFEQEPFRSLRGILENEMKGVAGAETSARSFAHLAAYQSYLYLMTGNGEMADSCLLSMKKALEDQEFTNNSSSFGLSRATILLHLAIAYDFAFDGFSPEDRLFLHRGIYKLMLSVTTSMGRSANYHLESNWMGVRWGSVLFASQVLRDELFSGQKEFELLNPVFYDSKERIRDHIAASHSPGGWFMESLSYQAYTWRFIAPGLIAFQNSHPGVAAASLEQMAPKMLHSLRQQITAVVSIPTYTGVGIKPDLADDNYGIGFDQYALGCRLLGADYTPYLKWMLDYMFKPEIQENFQYILYPLLFYPTQTEAMNPGEGGFKNYADTTQGVVMFRNRFSDENDIVATFNTSSNPVHGHGGPDRLTFRITGLGSAWAIGAGRTGEVAGQTNLFPDGNWQEQKTGNPGTLISYSFSEDGSGIAKGRGSCLGVQNHERTFMADYSGLSGAEALFVVGDRSDNGRTWRLNTPEYNQLEINEDGFTLTAPNGSSLKASIVNIPRPSVTVSEVRYGGKTRSHNPGLGYRGQVYSHNKAIDVACQGDILVVLTLQAPGQKHPKVHYNNSILSIGEKVIEIPE